MKRQIDNDHAVVSFGLALFITLVVLIWFATWLAHHPELHP